MTRPVDSVDIVAWNPHRGNTAARILDQLDAEVQHSRPGVIALCEVFRHYDDLAGWARENRYTIFQSKPRPPEGGMILGDGDVALLLDRHLDERKHHRVRMTKRWQVFSHDQLRGPRVYERVWFRTPPLGRWKVTASHWPTNGYDGGNRAAFRESAREALGALVARIPGTVGIDVGDHNEDVSRLREGFPAATVVGRGPDSLIAYGATAKAEVGPKAGSDHHLMRYTVTRRRPRWAGWLR